MVDRDEIVTLERRFWEAAGDPDFYRSRFADDGRCVFAMGILDKAATVASMDGAGEWAEVAFEDLAVTETAPDVVTLTYAARARDADGDPYETNVASVYVRREGAWLLALHTQTG